MREPAVKATIGAYDRPNQPWVCGLACEGRACPAGPTAGGECPALPECTPLRDGDRWRCNRSTLRGGVCDNGPTPAGACGCVPHCQPRRSLRSLRGQFVAACALLAAGVTLIVLSADGRDRVLAPGPLAAPHAQLLGRADTATNCAACHSAADGGLATWAATAIVGHGDRPSQSQRCVACHGKFITPELATSPHNLPLERLREITAAGGGESRGAFVRLASATFGPGDELACATCHREHHGTQFDVTAISNNACQTCHRQQFESLAADHPEFGVWPYERRTRIVFNHASHSTRYFPDRKQSFACASCHTADATGTVQLSPSFELACAACHDEKIATSVAQGVSMLTLPTLDIAALRSARHNLAGWPQSATGDFDGRLPPMMKLLLAADANAAQSMRTLGEDFEFLDVDPDDPRQLAACAAIAQAIEKLFADLAEKGPAAVSERLAAVAGRQVPAAEANALVAGLSVDTLRGAAAAWLRITATSGAASDGITTSAVDKSEPRTPNPEPNFAPAGTWFRDDDSLAIRYRPAGHADPVFTAWLEALAATPDLEKQPLALAAFKELSSQTAPGLCVTCHSVEQNSAGRLAINWRTHDRTSEPRPFTKFSHGPHLALPQLADCTSCHAIDSRVTAAATHAGWNPRQFANEFLPISKNHCAECHTAAAAGDRCQSCHNYHVERGQGSGFGGQGLNVVNALSNP